MLGDGLAHRLALLRVGEGGVEGGAGHPDGTGGDVDTAHLEHAEDLGQAPSGVADQVGRRDPMVGVRHLDRLDPLVAELAHRLAHGDALEGLARFLLHDEGRDALNGARGERDERRPLAVGDPRLGAVEDVLLAVAGGAATNLASVAPGVGLGEGERAAPLARRHVRQPALLLLLVAVRHQQGGRHGVGVDDAGEAHPPVRQLLDHGDVGQQVEAQAAVRLGDRDAEEAHVAHLRHDLFRIGVRPFELGGDGDHLVGHETPDRLDHLGPDGVVHGSGGAAHEGPK